MIYDASMSEFKLLKNAVKYPTSLIIRGQDLLGIELAKSLLEQGGFVILIDEGSDDIEKYLPLIDSYTNLILMDYSGISTLQSELRRLDYVFYLNHQFSSTKERVSTQEFLQASNYLDAILDLTSKFDSKFLLSTSIKAHQSIVASKVIDINYELSTAEKYSVYSELEIQRYSESLVKEYQDKVGINSRIVRLGTLLGRGMEIDIDSTLIKLIIEALQGESLMIPGDGLETDYYVHYLDAAYGIIKAQFSPNTKGQIFTLANEEEISILGVAYKLIELVPSAKEIHFDSEDTTLPPIKLYKPAINLTSIGWSARVSFERGLSQTIDYLKSRLIEVNGEVASLQKDLIPLVDKDKKQRSFKERVLDFFFITSAEDDPVVRSNVPPVPVNTEGALARLIAERKNQEKARKGSIIVANNKLRDALVKKPERTVLQRIDLWLNDLFFRIKQRLSVLKNMTLTDFVFWILGICAFLLVYFILIAPLLSLSRSLFLVHSELSDLNMALSSMDFNSANIKCNELSSDLIDIEARVSDLEYLFIVTQKQDSYTDLQTFIVELKQHINGYENITEALIPFGEMALKYSPKFIQRLDGQLLSVESNTDLSKQLELIYQNRSLLQIGVNSINTTRGYIDQYFVKLPEWFQSLYGIGIETLGEIDAELPLLQDVYNYIPLLSGNDKVRYYALFLQDEERFTPSGGILTGYFLLKVSDGAIVSVKYTDLSDLVTLNPNLTKSSIDEIALVTTKLIDESNVDFNDINYIPSINDWFRELEEVVEAKEGVDVDMSIVFNLEALAKLSKGGLEYKQVDITDGNFFEKMNSLLPEDASSSERNELLNTYFSMILEKRFNDIVSQPVTLEVIGELINNGHIRLNSSEPIIKKFLNSVFEQTSVKDNITIGMNYDTESIKFSSRSGISLVGSIKVNNDLSSIKTLKLDFDSNYLESSYVCAPTGKDSIVKDWIVTETDEKFQSQAFDLSELQKICSIFLPDEDNRYAISYYSTSFEKPSNSSYNYVIKIDSLPGILTTYDIEFQFESSLDNVEALTEGVIEQEDSYLYKGSFYGSKIFSFEIKSNGE